MSSRQTGQDGKRANISRCDQCCWLMLCRHGAAWTPAGIDDGDWARLNWEGCPEARPKSSQPLRAANPREATEGIARASERHFGSPSQHQNIGMVSVDIPGPFADLISPVYCGMFQHQVVVLARDTYQARSGSSSKFAYLLVRASTNRGVPTPDL